MDLFDNSMGVEGYKTVAARGLVYGRGPRLVVGGI